MRLDIPMNDIFFAGGTAFGQLPQGKLIRQDGTLFDDIEEVISEHKLEQEFADYLRHHFPCS